MRILVAAFSVALVGLVLTGCGDDTPEPAEVPDSMHVTSSVLHDDEPIAPPYACSEEGDAGTSPPLSWSDEPAGTTAFAVTMTDPDADDFVHWGVLDLPATVHSLSAGQRDFGDRVVVARNDFDAPGYGAPCPPGGSTHHYVVTAWALEERVDDLSQLPEAAIAQGMITVTFRR